MLALLVDYAVILGWMAVLAAAMLVLRTATGRFDNWLALGTIGAQALGFLLLVLPVAIYLFAGEASTQQATLGKRMMHLRVVDTAGGRPAGSRILLRTIVKLLPWEVAHFAVWNIVARTAEGSEMPIWLVVVAIVANLLPVLYLAIVVLRTDGRGPHDLIAGTRVVADDATPHGGRRS